MKQYYSLILLLIISFSVFSHTNRMDKINPYYHNKFNPFLQALNLDQQKLSLSRDSARVFFKDGTKIDILLKDKKLWNITMFDEEDNIVEIGNFKDGNGKVILKFKSNEYIAKFKNGLLNDTVTFSHTYNSIKRPRYIHIFKDGLLNGKSYSYSLIDYRVVSSISTFKKGIITMTEQYGIKTISIPLFYFMLRSKIKESDKVCSRTVYEKGKIISHECFISKKCRRCGY